MGTREVGMFGVLPLELCIHILSLLPVESLLVLRAVCKWLGSIIDDESFASFHLRHFPDNVLRNRFFAVRAYYVEPSRILNAVVLDVVSSSDPHPAYTVHILNIGGPRDPIEGALDGLVLQVGRRSGFPDHAVLWNPSIRRARHLPFLPLPDLKYAMGYHSSRNDYKVVAVGFEDEDSWVYSVKSGSWTSIPGSPSSFERSISEHLPFKDGVAWLTEPDRDDDTKPSCVWLDFETERFCCADEDLMEVKQGDLCGLVALDGGSTVGLWGYDLEGQPSVWALETRTKSWLKRHEIVSPMQLRGGLCTMSVVERNGKPAWVRSMTEDAEAVSRVWPSSIIDGVYIESLRMLH